MPTSNPKFWALIGFGVGAVIASAGSVATPLDSTLGGLIQFRSGRDSRKRLEKNISSDSLAYGYKYEKI